MKSELLSQEKNIVAIKVTVDQASYSAQLKKTYAEIAKRVNIPGFRKGKAPKVVLEMRLGKDSIMSQALEDMLPKVLDEVCNEYDLEPVASPVIDDLNIKEGEDVTFIVKYEIQPEVALPELSDITVDLPVFTVSESMVDEALENMKKRFSIYKPVTRPARHGDKVRAAYSLIVKDDDGKDIVSHEPQIDTFELDNLSMRPEIGEALIGTEAGTKKSADVKISDDYKDKTVAGRMAHYEFDVIEVQEPVAPEMNDEFFGKVTSEDVHSEEELRAVIRKNLNERLQADARTVAENEAVAKITEASRVELPESMVRRQQEHLRRRFEENVKQRTKMSLEEYYKSEGHDLKELEENLKKDARRDVLGYLVMDSCAKKFGISVQKEDLDGEVAQMAANYGISSDSIKDMLKKRPEDFENMISQARYRKTLQAIMEKVKVNEVKKGVDAEAPATQN